MQVLSHTNGYKEIFESIDKIDSEIEIRDHLYGFDSDLGNNVLDTLHNYAVQNNKNYSVFLQNPMEPCIQQKYPKFKIFYQWPHYVFDGFYNYRVHPELKFKNFLCSFNNSGQVGRQMLVAALAKFGLYNTEYCSKNFVFTTDRLDGHLEGFLNSQQMFYKKFFISDSNTDFFQSTNSFGDVPAILEHRAVKDHPENIYRLENKITDSFLQLVSESHSCTYYPMVTEKFLYSIITRGLYLAYAQPGWHRHLEEVWGFKKYNNIFNYDFDQIQNPVIRLVELVTMISKFSHLSTHDWHDIYQLEQDTIEFNHDHYYSRKFKQHLLEKITT